MSKGSALIVQSLLTFLSKSSRCPAIKSLPLSLSISRRGMASSGYNRRQANWERPIPRGFYRRKQLLICRLRQSPARFGA